MTSEPYRYGNVKIGGGGYITGMVFHPTVPDLAYVRTDMGGAYRMDPATRTWTSIQDWMQGYGDSGVESIAVDPQDPQRVYLFIGTHASYGASRLLRSTDQGTTVEIIGLPTGMGGAGGNDDGRGCGERLVVDPHLPNKLLCGTRQKGLWQSLDRGTTWTQVTSFPVSDTTGAPWANMGITFVLLDPRSSTDGTATQTIYVGIARTGTNLYRSTNGGATWSAVPGQPTQLTPERSWTPANLNIFPYRAALGNRGTLYLTYPNNVGPNGMDEGEVYKVGNVTGASPTWTRITPDKVWGGAFSGISVQADNEDVVMTGTMDRWYYRDEVYRSTNGGASWTPVYGNERSTAPSTTAVFDLSDYQWARGTATDDSSANLGGWICGVEIDPHHANRVYLVEAGLGLQGCDDIQNLDSGGVTHWGPRCQGIEQTAMGGHVLASPPTGPQLISVMADIGGFVHQDVTVSPRTLSPTFGGGSSVDFAELSPAQFVRVGNVQSNNDLGLGCWSGDAGATWTTFNPPVPGRFGSVVITADGSAIIWATNGNPPYRSTDHGQTWTACGGLNVAGATLTSDRVNPNKVYGVTSDYSGWPWTISVWRSTDGGATFTKVNTFESRTWDNTPQALAMPGFEGRLYFANGEKGLYRSTDSGATVSNVNGSVTSVAVVGFGAPAPGSVTPALFLCGQVSGVDGIYRSDDDGANWVRCNDDLHHWGSWSAIIGDPRIYGRYYLGTIGRGIVIGDRDDGTVGWNAASVSAAESAGSVVLSASRTGITAGAVTVAWSTLAGTALAGTDYVAVSGTLTWAAGDATSRSVTVAVLDNQIYDQGRSFSVVLSNPQGASLGTVSAATVTLTNVNPPPPGTIAFVSSSTTVGEADGTPVVAWLRRSGGNGGAVSAHWTTVAGTASANLDFTAGSGTVSWADGDAADKPISVTIADDVVRGEGTEDFQVIIDGVTGTTLGAPTASTVSISDNDLLQPGSLAFSATSAALTTTEAAGAVTLAVERTGAFADGAVTVAWATSPGTALAGTDYVAASGVLAWADGDAAAKSLTVGVLHNGVFDAGRTFRVVLGSAGGGASLGSLSVAQVFLGNTDPAQPGSVAFTSGSVTVAESVGSISLSLRRSGGRDGAVAVHWRTVAGSASAGADFIAGSGTVAWSDGDSADKVVSVAIIDDVLRGEPGESFLVDIDAVSGGVVTGATSAVTATILDNDPLQFGAIAFTTATTTVTEAAGTTTVAWLRRSGGSDGAVSIHWTTAVGTAAIGSDYQAGSNSVAWADGDATDKPVVVTIVDDLVRGESIESFGLTLDHVGGGVAVGSLSAATVSITDNDPLQPGSLAFIPASISVTRSESAGPVELTVRRSGFADGPISVEWSTVNGTASGGVRFQVAAGTLTWADGDTTDRTIQVLLIDDLTGDQVDQWFQVTLGSPTGGAVLGSASAARITVIDDDPPRIDLVAVTVQGTCRPSTAALSCAPSSVGFANRGDGTWTASLLVGGGSGSATVSAVVPGTPTAIRKITISSSPTALPAPSGRN